MPFKTISLHSTAGGSDKIYTINMEQAVGGFVVNYTHGKREVGPFQSGTKTKSPVSQAEAEKIFAALEKEKRTGKSKYGTYGGEAVEQAPVKASADDRADIACMELTAIMDAEGAVRILRSDDFAAQEKHDGIRLTLHATAKKVTAYNRTGGARAFPLAVEREAKKLAQVIGPFLVDGELVGERYHIFDMLELNGQDYRKDTFEHRMFVLLNWFQLAASLVDAISMVETAFDETSKIALLEALHSINREGIVMKRKSAPYTAGRSKDWLKFKFVATASVVVTKHNDKRSVTMSLLHGGQLREVGSLPIPTNKQIPEVNDIIEVRYRKADPKSLNLIEAVYLTVREDVALADCTSDQLKFTTKAA